MKINNNRSLFKILKFPIITDKTTRYIEDNRYCFAVSHKANKTCIKNAIEYIFNVKVKTINTINQKPKKRNVGRFSGYTTKYKKAIIQLHDEYQINIFSDN
uniref:Large ribosomal subunit protein uL23c n=1 Tax=Crouania attenuata TaxID=42002 RepID=A0A4D6WPF9_9FLOR|nr:ribosomal protein L23 [Crouania attenuata]